MSLKTNQNPLSISFQVIQSLSRTYTATKLEDYIYLSGDKNVHIVLYIFFYLLLYFFTNFSQKNTLYIENFI